MKINHNLLAIKVLILILFVQIPVSCKKGSKNDQPDTPEQIKIEEATYKPYQLMSFTWPDATFTGAATATMDGKEVNIEVSNGTAVILTPQTTAGKHVLQFTANQKRYEVPLTIGAALTDVKTADEYLTDILRTVDSVTVERDKLLADTVSPESVKVGLAADIQKRKTALQQYRADFNKLSQEEKKVFAQFYAANRHLIQEVKVAARNLNYALANNSALTDRIPYARSSALAVQNTASVVPDHAAQIKRAMEDWWIASKPVLANTVALAATLIAGPKLAVMFPVVGVIGAGLAVSYFGIELIDALKENYIALEKLFVTIAAPFEDMSFKEASGQLADKAFASGKLRLVTVWASFRGISGRDGQNGLFGAAINKFLTNYQTYKQKVSDIISKIPEVVRPSNLLATPPTNAVVKPMRVHAKYVSVENVSNPNVKVDISKNQDGTVGVTATSATSGKQTFTYDLVYTDADISAKAVRTKLEGEVEVVTIKGVNIISGNNQAHGPNERLIEPLKVMVLDQNGRAVKDATVEWKVTIGSGRTDAATSTTDASGMAETRFTLGEEGVQWVAATVRDEYGQPINSVTFKMTANWVPLITQKLIGKQLRIENSDGSYWSFLLLPNGLFSLTSSSEGRVAGTYTWSVTQNPGVGVYMENGKKVLGNLSLNYNHPTLSMFYLVRGATIYWDYSIYGSDSFGRVLK